MFNTEEYNILRKQIIEDIDNNDVTSLATDCIMELPMECLSENVVVVLTTIQVEGIGNYDITIFKKYLL